MSSLTAGIFQFFVEFRTVVARQIHGFGLVHNLDIDMVNHQLAGNIGQNGADS